MKNNKVKQVTINLKLLNDTKNIYATLIYGYLQACETDGRQPTPDGYIMCSNQEVTANLGGLTRYQQREGFRLLEELGLIDTKLMGFPAFRFVKVMPLEKDPKEFKAPKFEFKEDFIPVPINKEED